MMVKVVILALSATLCLANQSHEHKRPSSSNIQHYCNGKDQECLRRLFEVNKHCCVRHEGAKAPECFEVPRIRYESAYFSLSIDDYDTRIFGLDKCYISEYFLNKKTGDIVTAVTCPKISFESERILKQHRPLKEDKYYKFNISSTYEDITLTTVGHMRDGWNLCTAHTSASFNVKEYEVLCEDKEVRDYVDSLLTPHDVLASEVFAVKARILFRAFINSVLCNFRCE